MLNGKNKPRRKKSETEEQYQARLSAWLEENAADYQPPATATTEPKPKGKPRRKKGELLRDYKARLQEWEDSNLESPGDFPEDPTDVTVEDIEAQLDELLLKGLEEEEMLRKEREREAIQESEKEEVEYADPGFVRKKDPVNTQQNEIVQNLIQSRKGMQFGYKNAVKLVRGLPNGTLFLFYAPRYKRYVVAYSINNREGDEVTLAPLSGGAGIITAGTLKGFDTVTSPLAFTVLRALPELTVKQKPLRF